MILFETIFNCFLFWIDWLKEEHWSVIVHSVLFIWLSREWIHTRKWLRNSKLLLKQWRAIISILRRRERGKDFGRRSSINWLNTTLYQPTWGITNSFLVITALTGLWSRHCSASFPFTMRLLMFGRKSSHFILLATFSWRFLKISIFSC